MKHLTQEVAERCARAYGLHETEYHWFNEDGELWLFKTGNFLDPYFWRPRLEDRLIEVTKKKPGRRERIEILILLYRDHNEFRIVIDDSQEPYLQTGNYDSIELALCEAIEQLTAGEEE